jgi:hypothetical protein
MLTRSRLNRLATPAVAVIGAVSTAVGAIVGVAAVPTWAVVAVAVDVWLASTAMTHALTARLQKSRIRALWASNVLLAGLLIGVWIYAAWPASGFVTVVANRDVTLSPAPDTPPRQTFDATVLPEGEQNSADCYVRVRGVVWLDFGEGWAPLSLFHYRAGFRHTLPPRCG